MMGWFSYIVTLELDIANFTISNQQPNTLSTTNAVLPFFTNGAGNNISSSSSEDVDKCCHFIWLISYESYALCCIEYAIDYAIYGVIELQKSGSEFPSKLPLKSKKSVMKINVAICCGNIVAININFLHPSPTSMWRQYFILLVAFLETSVCHQNLSPMLVTTFCRWLYDGVHFEML